MKIALVATEFGFGPAAKAVAVARALVRDCPRADVQYFGRGADLRFVQRNAPFVRTVVCNTDEPDERCMAVLARADVVINCMNLEILSKWTTDYPPCFFIDSLAWMWPSVPECASRAQIYFAQRYLVSDERARALSQTCRRCQLVGPIIDVDTLPPARQRREAFRESGKVILNLAGCVNPFNAEEFHRQYAIELTRHFVRAIGSRRGLICINEVYHDAIRSSVELCDVELAILSNREFKRQLSQCSLLLTCPGLTTTLEAVALDCLIKFVLPQNLSQHLALDRYVYTGACEELFTLRSFGEDVDVEMLDERTAVQRIAEALRRILASDRGDMLEERFARLLADDPGRELAGLKTLRGVRGDGASEIASAIMEAIVT